MDKGLASAEELSAQYLLARIIDGVFKDWWEAHGKFATGGQDERETARLAWLAGWLMCDEIKEIPSE